MWHRQLTPEHQGVASLPRSSEQHDQPGHATITERTSVAGRDAVVAEVTGEAYRTGEHRFVLDPYDDPGEGFVLR
jgi:hypothetical protein